MQKQVQILSSLSDTLEAASLLAKSLEPGSVVCLKGDLGVGKTTFVKGIGKALGIDEDLITSPTFIYLNLIDTFAHFDLYRISSQEHFLSMGFEEHLQPPYITCIEWPELIESIIPPDALWVEITHLPGEKRQLEISQGRTFHGA